ncbi:MAG: sugar ABC transporter permease [Acutalibacter sp.]|nr:sugar ABC transporter permease [Acutalibacter sp.]
MKRSGRKYWQLYLCLLPVLAYFVVFHYLPMYGVQIAFRDFNPLDGVTGSNWVGFKHFQRFFNSYYFQRLLVNTLVLSLYQLVVSFPMPILLAIMLNELNSNKFRKTMQMVTYAPHFLSVVVVVGMMTNMLSPRTGIVNHMLSSLGVEPIFFMSEPGWFRHLYVWSGVWQSTGWSSIIYIAAIAGIDSSLYEAAIVDGASRLKRIWHITLPGLLPTAIILLIMQCGSIMSIGFEKVYLMQNDMNLSTSQIISTYVYEAGLVEAQFSFAAAIDLFNSVINCVLLVIVNTISKKASETSLF